MMYDNGSLLLKLVAEDFGLEDRDGSRWAKAERHDSLVIDKERGLFYWNSRNLVGPPLDYLMKVRGLSFQDARDYIRKVNGSDTFAYTIYGSEKEDVVVYPKLVDVFFEDGARQELRSYWYKRGITDSIINRFRLGFYNGFVTVPFFVDGTFRQFQLRKDDPENGRSIRNFYRGVGPLLYNSDILKLVDTVYITEGITDCIRLNQEGFPAVSSNTGAEGWIKTWYTYFMNVKEIYVVYDNDNAGRKGAARVAKNLGESRTKIFTFAGRESKYDIVEYFRDGNTRQEFENMVKSESRYLFSL